MNRESPHPRCGSRDGPAGPSPVPGRPHMWQVEDAIRPALGAVVMASGVVSIDLYSDHRLVLSAITLWFALVVWLLLAVVVSVRLAYERDRFAREASSPAGFTSVGRTAVLGTRLAIADYRRCRSGPPGGVGSLLGLACRAGPAALEDPAGRDLLCPHDGH